MPRHALKPSAAIAQVLRERRAELGLSLRDVAARASELGERIPPATLDKIERGTQEPGLRRFYALIRLYRLPLDLVPDLLEMEALAAAPPSTTDPGALHRGAREAFERGDPAAGMAAVFALRRLAAPTAEARAARQRALILTAASVSALGRVRLAHQIIQGLLAEPPEPSVRVDALRQATANWTELGSFDMALAVILRLEELVSTSSPAVRATVDHIRSTVLLGLGRLDEAEAAIDRADRVYNEAIVAADAGGTGTGSVTGSGTGSGTGTGVGPGRHPADAAANLARALGIRIDIMIARGDHTAALARARTAIEAAEAAGLRSVLPQRFLQAGRCLLALGRPAEALPPLQSALGHSLITRYRTAEFRAHYWLWKAHDACGDREPAKLAYASAVDLLDRIDEVTAETIELREALARETLAREALGRKPPGRTAARRAARPSSRAQ